MKKVLKLLLLIICFNIVTVYAAPSELYVDNASSFGTGGDMSFSGQNVPHYYFRGSDGGTYEGYCIRPDANEVETGVSSPYRFIRGSMLDNQNAVNAIVKAGGSNNVAITVALRIFNVLSGHDKGPNKYLDWDPASTNEIRALAQSYPNGSDSYGAYPLVAAGYAAMSGGGGYGGYGGYGLSTYAGGIYQPKQLANYLPSVQLVTPAINNGTEAPKVTQTASSPTISMTTEGPMPLPATETNGIIPYQRLYNHKVTLTGFTASDATITPKFECAACDSGKVKAIVAVNELANQVGKTINVKDTFHPDANGNVTFVVTVQLEGDYNTKDFNSSTYKCENVSYTLSFDYYTGTTTECHDEPDPVDPGPGDSCTNASDGFCPNGCPNDPDCSGSTTPSCDNAHDGNCPTGCPNDPDCSGSTTPTQPTECSPEVYQYAQCINSRCDGDAGDSNQFFYVVTNPSCSGSSSSSGGGYGGGGYVYGANNGDIDTTVTPLKTVCNDVSGTTSSVKVTTDPYSLCQGDEFSCKEAEAGSALGIPFFQKLFQDTYGGRCITCTAYVSSASCKNNDNSSIDIVEGVEQNADNVCEKPSKVNVKECVIDATDASADKNTFLAKKSLYCNVYCKESYHVTLPGNKDVTSGRYFDINTSVYGTKTCYTDQINFEQFKTDFNNNKGNDAKIKQLVNEYNFCTNMENYIDLNFNPKVTFTYDDNTSITNNELKSNGKVNYQVSQSKCGGEFNDDYTTCTNSSYGSETLTTNSGQSYTVIKPAYALASITKNARYITPSSIRLQYPSGALAYDVKGSYNNDTTNSSELNGLPVKFQTPAKQGGYNYSVSISNIGEYYDATTHGDAGNPGSIAASSKVGRIIGSNKSVVKAIIDDVYKNNSCNYQGNFNSSGKWQCKYYVNCPECDNACKKDPTTNQFYCKDGKSCSQSEYKSECGCQVPGDVDRNYHCLDGEICDEDKYKSECSNNACRKDSTNDKYYCANGEECSETEYKSSCGCREQGGKHYCKNGDECSTTDYNKECSTNNNKACTKSGNSYTCSNGRSCSESEYKSECGCQVRDDKYYCKNGEECQQTDYESQCRDKFYCPRAANGICEVDCYDNDPDCPLPSDRSCTIEKGVYYCVDGKKCNLLQYNLECGEIKNSSCAKPGDVDNKWHCKNGNVCTQSEYKNECDPCPSCAVVCKENGCTKPNTGGGECPKCNVVCEGCIYDKGLGLNVDYRALNSQDINPNNRDIGKNWTFGTNSDVDEANINITTAIELKAYATVKEIKENGDSIYDVSGNNSQSITNTNPNFVMKVLMDSTLINYIKNYNKQNSGPSGYMDDTLKCYDYNDGSTTYENIFCYSKFIDLLLKDSTTKSKITVNANRKDESQRGTDPVGNYWTVWTKAKNDKSKWNITTSYDVEAFMKNYDKIGIGPSWK